MPLAVHSSGTGWAAAQLRAATLCQNFPDSLGGFPNPVACTSLCCAGAEEAAGWHKGAT